MHGVNQQIAECITNIWKNCFRSVAMEVVEKAEILIIPAEVQVKFTRRRVPVHTCLPFPPDWSLGSAHVRNRNFFSATLPSSSVPEIPKLSCKMATLICKQITWSTAFPLRSKESALRFLHSAAAREQPVKELFIKFILTLSNEIWGNYIRTTEHQSCSKYMSLLC